MADPTVLLRFEGGAVLDSANYADFAKKAIAKKEGKSGSLTTSKLRSIYSQIMNVYAKISEPDDFERYLSELQHLKVRMAYESGRDPVVKDFIQSTYLADALDRVRNYEQFILYCRYAEALVAYFKFFGGRDN